MHTLVVQYVVLQARCIWMDLVVGLQERLAPSAVSL